jgi:hypothetical protein
MSPRLCGAASRLIGRRPVVAFGSGRVGLPALWYCGVGMPAVCIADFALHQSPSADGHGAGGCATLRAGNADPQLRPEG